MGLWEGSSRSGCNSIFAPPVGQHREDEKRKRLDYSCSRLYFFSACRSPSCGSATTVW